MQTAVFIIIVLTSLYASLKDLVERTYPFSIELVLLVTGISSLLAHIVVLNFSGLFITRGALSISLAIIIALIWHKFGIAGTGDGKYLIALALSFPTYPGSLACSIATALNYRPMVYASTPFSIIILTNATFALCFLVTLIEVSRSKLLRSFYLIFVLLILVASTIFTSKCLLLLPLPAILWVMMNATKRRLAIPFIPCIFAGFISSLTLGDLLLWLVEG